MCVCFLKWHSPGIWERFLRIGIQRPHPRLIGAFQPIFPMDQCAENFLNQLLGSMGSSSAHGLQKAPVCFWGMTCVIYGFRGKKYEFIWDTLGLGFVDEMVIFIYPLYTEIQGIMVGGTFFGTNGLVCISELLSCIVKMGWQFDTRWCPPSYKLVYNPH